MARLTIGDRVAAMFVGAVIGAIIGAAIAWLLGVYSNTLGPSMISLSFGKVIAAWPGSLPYSAC